MKRRLRIGNYVIGIRANMTEHALFGNFMIGKVADTIGVLNSINGTDEQMLFFDYDTAKLGDILKEIRQMGLSGFLFKSYMDNQETHYFFISPFRYSKKIVRYALAESELVDGKFIAVYMRDGVNAIRLIPKFNGGRQSRLIVPIMYLDYDETSYGNRDRLVSGMCLILFDKWPETRRMIAGRYDLSKQDHTSREDITLREYETIRF